MRAGRPPVHALARAALAALVAVALVGSVGSARAPALGLAAAADEEWLVEFEAVCGGTQEAMALASDELRALLARCDRLRPRIDGLDASRRKVYQRRLQQCRDLYRFVLESREG